MCFLSIGQQLPLQLCWRPAEHSSGRCRGHTPPARWLAISPRYIPCAWSIMWAFHMEGAISFLHPATIYCCFYHSLHVDAWWLDWGRVVTDGCLWIWGTSVKDRPSVGSLGCMCLLEAPEDCEKPRCCKAADEAIHQLRSRRGGGGGGDCGCEMWSQWRLKWRMYALV